MNTQRVYKKVFDSVPLSRKEKKFFIGSKESKKKLKEKIERFVKGESELLFCPNCGCDRTTSVKYGVEYPEVYWSEFCFRCHSQVGGQDNSEYSHILQEMRNNRHNA